MKLTLTLTLASTCLVFALLLEQVLREPGVARPHSTLPALQTLVETGPMQLRVLTLNTWGLWLVSRRRADRMAALAAFLRSPECTADVVFLQEVWVVADVELLRQAGAEGGLPHSHHWQSGAIGCGLLVLSRWPIAQVGFHPYSTRGDPAAVLQGDFLAGKGVGWAALDTPAGTLSCFNTHLSANYAQDWQAGAFRLAPDCRLPRDGLAGTRLAQMLELAAFVRARGAGATAGVVLAGDLNSAPDTLEYTVLKALLPELRDAWADACPLLLGATSNALENSFWAAGSPEGHRPARLDHIWSTGRATAAELALTDTGRGCSFSDHLAVKATITIRSSGSGSDIASTNGGGSKAGGDGEQQQPGLAPAAAALQLMRQFPEPFQEAAAQIEVAVAAMARGRSLFVRLAAGLWAAGLGCLGALAVRPWAAAARPADEYLLLLGGMGVGLGWAGVVFVVGFVARGMELRALQQAAAQLRVAVGAAPHVFHG